MDLVSPSVERWEACRVLLFPSCSGMRSDVLTVEEVGRIQAIIMPLTPLLHCLPPSFSALLLPRREALWLSSSSSSSSPPPAPPPPPPSRDPSARRALPRAPLRPPRRTRGQASTAIPGRLGPPVFTIVCPPPPSFASTSTPPPTSRGPLRGGGEARGPERIPPTPLGPPPPGPRVRRARPGPRRVRRTPGGPAGRLGPGPAPPGV